LRLSHEDLWHVTYGEFLDLLAGWRYREFLEAQKRAELASLITAPWYKHPISVQDIAGVWDDETMRAYGKMEAFKLFKDRIIKKRRTKEKMSCP